jgi:hypothetical protein
MRPSGRQNRPLITYVSHVSPYPPQGDNEYRIERMVTWLDSKGWDIVLLYCPLAGEEPDETQLEVLCDGCDNVVYVNPDGQVRYSLARPDLEAVINSLDGRSTGGIAGLVDEASQRSAAQLGAGRTFITDALIEVIRVIDEELAPKIVLTNYVFMTRGLPLLRSRAFKIVDTMDQFSAKAGKVTPFVMGDSIPMSDAEEVNLLSQADALLAIEPGAAEKLRRIMPETCVLTVGIDMRVDTPRTPPVEAPIVLVVASSNPMNAKGLRHFLRFAWPRVLRAVPGVQLRVVGAVGAIMSGDELAMLRVSPIDNLEQCYDATRVVIIPTIAGTDVKIRALEALAHLRPFVTWPSGVQGVPPELRELCDCVTDWYAFSEAMIRILTDEAAARRLIARRERIAELLCPNAVFKELDELLATLPSPDGSSMH